MLGAGQAFAGLNTPSILGGNGGTNGGGGGAPSGAAGGALTGTYPNPTLAATSANRIAVVGTQNLPNDGSLIPNVANFASLTGDYVGQIATSRYEMAWWDGASWRGTENFVDQISSFSTNGEAFRGVVSNGVDNVISIQNLQSNHFSAMRFLNMFNGEVGAVGWGNTNTTQYMGCNFLEDFGSQSGFYFTSAGNGLCSGMEKTTGDFVRLKAGTQPTNESSSVVFRVDNVGRVTTSSNITFGGILLAGTGVSQITSVAGLLNGAALDPANAITINTTITSGMFKANSNSAFSTGNIDFNAGNSGSGLNYSLALHGIQEMELGSRSVPFLTIVKPGDGYNAGGYVTIGSACTNQGDSAGFATLQVQGSFGTTNRSTATSYTLTDSDSTVEVTATGQIITLADATFHCAGRICTIKLTAAGSCTITNVNGSQNIDGALSYTLTGANSFVTVQSDGANWNVISSGIGQALFTAVHFGGNGSSPTVVTNAGAGVTGATATISSTDSTASDSFFVLTVNTGTSPSGASTICTITFANTYNTAAHVVFCAANVNAAGLSDCYVSPSATTISFQVGAVALTTGTTYKWNFFCAK